MDLTTLGRTLGFSFAAGVNLYATVAILGLAARYGWVSLPAQFQAFNNDVVIWSAIVIMPCPLTACPTAAFITQRTASPYHR